jgi:5'-nucleotidase
MVNCSRQQPALVKVEGSLLPIDEEISPDAEVEGIIAPYREKVEKEMKQVLSQTDIDLTKQDGAYESTLGNLVADMSYAQANPVFEERTGQTIDFALFNYGGLRSSISKGPITREDAFKLIPFENMFVVVELDYSGILEFVDYLRRGKRAHPVSSDLRLHIGPNDFDMSIRGEPVDGNRNYFILTTDYLQKGGDSMNFLKDPVRMFPLDYKMRNALIDYFSTHGRVNPVLDRRLTME